MKTRKIIVALAIGLYLLFACGFDLQAADERSIKRNSSAARPQVAKLQYGLVIGNGGYKDAPLKNPANDAKDMASALAGVGFEVDLLVDADQRAMEEAIQKLGTRLRAGGVGLFYFAGHGVQVNNVNYLIPVGARISTEADVRYEAVDANRVLSQMQEAGNEVNLVFLDACRNNPYARSFRSAHQGLAQMESPSGSLVAFATAPGSVAADGTGRNGIFTKHLLDAIRTPGLEIGILLRQVRSNVQKETGGAQTPFELSSLVGQYYFAGAEAHTRVSAEDAAGASGQTGTSTLTSRTGESYTDSTTGMEFVYVPGGCFQMGDTFGDGEKDEKPVHEVCVDSFYMGKYEVTQGEYQAITGGNTSFRRGNRYPVEMVSWNEAQSFIRALNGKSGKTYRLPTEAEWEYAARSGGKSEKFAGAGSPEGVAWYGPNSGGNTHQVGTKSPNGLGLYDMSGNVLEWCNDWYGDNYYSSSPRQNPTGPASGEDRVLRGGYYNSEDSRSANRSRKHPDMHRAYLGFRLVLQASAPR